MMIMLLNLGNLLQKPGVLGKSLLEAEQCYMAETSSIQVKVRYGLLTLEQCLAGTRVRQQSGACILYYIA